MVAIRARDFPLRLGAKTRRCTSPPNSCGVRGAIWTLERRVGDLDQAFWIGEERFKAAWKIEYGA